MSLQLRSVLLGLLFCLTLGTVQPATAALLDVTWTGGTAFGGNDGLGLFGPAGVMPANTSYITKFRFNTAIGFGQNVTNGSENVVGGTFFSPATPIPLVSATVTINGTTVPAVGDYYSEFFRQTGQGASQINTLVQRTPSAPVGGELFQRILRTGNFYSLPLGQPAEIDITASDSPGGQFLQLNRDGQGNISGPTTQIQLIPTHLSITAVVPEPGTLLLTVTCVVGTLMLFRSRR